MANPQTASQRRTTGRVMHELKHGELKRGPGGKGGKVTNPKQAIAIALKESGASKYESKRGNARNARKTKAAEAKGRTGQQEREGKSKVGASARKTTARKAGPTRRQLYERAQRKHVAGRSRMSKAELRQALGLR